jgi:uncharacterized membrane protein YGL010W
MEPLAEQLAAWMPYHLSPANRFAHFVAGILFWISVLIPLGWARVEAGGVTLSLAMLPLLALFAYAALLDRTVGGVMAFLLIGIGFVADRLSQLPLSTGAEIAVGVMAVRFAVAGIGHSVIEKKMHSLLAFGPAGGIFAIEHIYLIAVILIGLGLKPQLKQDMQRLDPQLQL